MRKMVFDIETKNTFQEVGSNDPAALDISLLVVYDYGTDTYHSFLEEDFPKLWPLLEQADMLIGYNSDHFDIPLLNKYYAGDLTQIKSLDLLVEIRRALGRRVKLDQIAEGTFGKNKLASSGLQAVDWWREGKIEEIRKYCEEDVRLTKEVYDHALKNGQLVFKEGGKKQPIKLDTSAWEQKIEMAMNHTLPF